MKLLRCEKGHASIGSNLDWSRAWHVTFQALSLSSNQYLSLMQVMSVLES